MTLYNVIMLLIVVLMIVVVVCYFMRPDPLARLDSEEAEDPFCMQSLIFSVRDYLGEYEKLNVQELNMNRAQAMKIDSGKKRYARAKKTCCYGDTGAKAYIKGIIKKVLLEYVGVNEQNITHAIPFDDPERMDVRDKFDILLYAYRAKFGNQAMKKLIEVNHFDEPFGEGSGAYYKITAPQITKCFNQHGAIVGGLTFADRLEVVTQRVYAGYFGLGVVDELVEMDIDGIRGGTSGINESLVKVVGEIFSEDHGNLPMVSYNAVWMIYRGTEMHLSFLGFGSQKEFVRVASRIYKYDDPGMLDASKGGIIGKMMNGSRVVVTRPPAAESWAFFVRKLDVGSRMSFEQLMPDEGNDKLRRLISILVMAEENIALTGEQRTGKTTFLMSIIQYIKASYTIRVLEKESELNLRNVYPERDIHSFKDIEMFNGQMLLDLQKKTDGSVNLIGEVADYEQASWAIQTGETGSNQTIFTGHMKTVPDLIDYFRTACLSNTPGSNAKIEEALCARVLNWNIHLRKTIGGHRYVERVSMIMPHVIEDYPVDMDAAQREYYIRQTDRPTYDWVDIIRWVDGKYVFTGEIADDVVGRMALKLPDCDRAELLDLCEEIRQDVSGGQAMGDALDSEKGDGAYAFS